VIGVQGYGVSHRRRAEASMGPWVDIAAPGDRYYTTALQKDNTEESYDNVQSEPATSDLAAAHVAGVVAVMRTVNPDLSPYQIETGLCSAARKMGDLPYEDGRNDYFGCGALQFEHSIERIPWKLRILPHRVIRLAEDEQPWPHDLIVNPYLNETAWELETEVTWLKSDAVTGEPGGPSVAAVSADLDRLKQARSGPLAGSRSLGRLVARLLRAPNAAEPSGALEVEYELLIVDERSRVYLPALGNRSLPPLTLEDWFPARR
jgi:hypothetical protein